MERTGTAFEFGCIQAPPDEILYVPSQELHFLFLQLAALCIDTAQPKTNCSSGIEIIVAVLLGNQAIS